jgi:type II secretory pathway pseudopilin PulG
MRNTRKAASQRGFTITQMVVTLAIISVVSTFGVMGIRTARAEFRLQSSARLFASYVEKARADAIRRHAASGQESSIETFGPGTTSYAVTMDWGSGNVETRTFDLEDGMTFNTDAKKVKFDWRGRIEEAWVFQIRSEYLDKNLPVDVSGSGDITVGEQHFPDQSIPAVEISQVTGDVASDSSTAPEGVDTNPDTDPPPDGDPDVVPVDETPPADPTPTPPGHSGDSNGGNNSGGGNGNSSPTPTPTPTPTPDGTLPQCVSTISPDHITLSQSVLSEQTKTATFTMQNATGVRTISASQLGNGNSMAISLSLVRIDGSGSSVVSVTAKNGGGNRGTFVVEVAGSPACGTAAKLTVQVNSN